MTTPIRADVVLKGGQVIDGTGSPAFAADVALSGDTIVAIGNLADVTADRTLDVGGDIVRLLTSKTPAMNAVLRDDPSFAPTPRDALAKVLTAGEL